MSAPALILEKNMKLALDAGFAAAFGGVPERYFSAPGRTEIGGNHTDHQRGRVLAGTIQAFVPYDILDSFVAGIDGALGAGACHVLSIRPQGGVEAK